MPNIENKGPFFKRMRPDVQQRARVGNSRTPKERIIFNATRNIVIIKEQLIELRNSIDVTLKQLELLSSNQEELKEEVDS